MVLGPLLMLLFFAGIVIAVAVVVRWLMVGGSRGADPSLRLPHNTSLDILKERFARGEIDKDEFEERRTMTTRRTIGPLGRMMTTAVAASLCGAAGAAGAQQTGQPSGWGMGCCWGPGPMTSPGTMGWHMGSMPRHHQAMMQGIPAPYATMTDPLPRSPETLARGAAIYRQTCASCHGPNGRGDGEAGKDLSPPPGDLAWLARMPIGQWDAYLYWAIAEGGEAFGTGMPAHKDALSADDIWAVVTYIEAGLPAGSSGPTR